MQSEIYTSIRDRLQDKLPELLYVDLQKGQLDLYRQHENLPLPAALIEIKQLDWLGTAGGYQTGEAVISVCLYLNKTADTLDTTDQEIESLLLLDSQEAIFRALEKLSGNTFQPLIRVAEAILDDPDFVIARSDFKTSVYDDPSDSYILLPTAPKSEFTFSDN
ncbi:MAG: hypothetical protein FWH39_01645 [Bacteroidales bacterium]|nr:hypothetical protein [Bacteroidales bacterium]